MCLCADMEQAAWSAVPGLEGGQNEQNKKHPDSSMSVWYLMSAELIKTSVVFHFTAAKLAIYHLIVGFLQILQNR